MRARLKNAGAVVEVLRDGSERPCMLHADWARIDATEAEIAAQIAEDDVEAIRDAAACARRVRPKVGLSPGRVSPPVKARAAAGFAGRSHDGSGCPAPSPATGNAKRSQEAPSNVLGS